MAIWKNRNFGMSSILRTIIVRLFSTALVLQTVTLLGQIQPQDLSGKFERQVSGLHQEKVYIHTDRPIYITGETIWMSAYVVDAMLHIPNSLSRVLNIELLDNSGQPVKQVRIKMTDGVGNGQIFVSPDIPSGYFTLRAYTNWMKNFDVDYVFQKSIGVVNPSASASIDELSKIKDTTFVQFFPEGGSLVFGLKSKVAVKVSDGDGSGVVFAGLVYDDEENEVAKFTTSDSGFGSFDFLPKKGKTYNAWVAVDTVIQKYNLPKVEESGVVIKVTNQGNNFDLNFQSKNTAQSTFLVVIHTRGKIIRMKSLNLDVEQKMELLAKDITPGITHITILNDQFEPMAERLIFKYPKQNSISLNLPKQEYGKRDKVRLTLNSSDLEGSEAGQLSVSVFHNSEHIPANENIISNLLLTSDIKGKIEDLDVYFDSNNTHRAEQIDLLILTHGWRRFDWKNIIQDGDIQIKYPAELRGPILSGSLSKNGEKQLPKSILVDFIGTASVMNSSGIDSDGSFHFEVPFNVSNDKVHFFSLYDSLVTEQVDVYSPFDLKARNNTAYPISFSPKSKDILEELNVNIQLSQVYRDFSRINGDLPIIDNPETNFFGKPDYLYLLDDYTRFETVQDLFLEYIRSALIRQNNRQNGFYVVKEKKMFPVNAFTTIDGIPILDTDVMLNFDPLKIKKIEVMDDYYFIGSTRLNGIVNFSTYNGDFDQQDLPDYMIEKVYHSLQSSREFYSPDYSSDNANLKRIPDYRNTLYWNHSITLKDGEIKELEFFTSDDTGNYQIEINGITNTGRPFYLTENIYVTDN